MKVEFSQAQLVYEVGLTVPAFDLSTSAIAVVKALHTAFSGKFQVTPADIHVGGATRLSEWTIQVSLFAGRWLIDFRFGGYQVTCNLLQTPEDVSRAVECIDLTEKVAQSILPQLMQREVSARLSTWYRCDGGRNAALQHLARFAPTSLGIAPGFEGTQEIRFNIAGELANEAERWSTRFLFEPSQVEHAHLFVQMQSKYLTGGKYDTLGERRVHSTRIHQAVMKQAALEVNEVVTHGLR